MKATPFLQIVHVSDRHVVDANHDPKPAFLQRVGRAIRRVHPWLHESYQDGLAANDPEAAARFEAFVEQQTTRHRVWKDHPSWLVDTGDATTFGDAGSLKLAADQLTRLAPNFTRRLSLYGNHDAWPGRPPALSDGKTVTQTQKALLQTNGFGVAQASLPLALDGLGVPRVRLFTLDTVDHRPPQNFVALGKVDRKELDDLEQAVDGSATERSLRILACHHPVHYPPPRPKLPNMRIANDKYVARALDRKTKGGTRPFAHIVLSGHTHALYPALGGLPHSTLACNHPELGDHQCQLNVGSLMQFDRYRKRGDWPNQAQFLRFYYTDDPTLIIVVRQVAARAPGVKPNFGFVECRPGVYCERLAVAI